MSAELDTGKGMTMRRYHGWFAAVALCACAPLARALPAEESKVPAAPAAAAEAINAAEDVAVLKAVAMLGLSRSQLSDLLPALQSAQARLSELDTKEQAKLDAWKGSLEQSRKDLLSGKGSGSRATEQFALAQWSATQKRAALRADLVSSLRATLEKLLTPAQTAQMTESGRAVALSQRIAGWRGGGGGGMGGAAPGAAGNGGGGMTGRLDRVREMSPAEFQDFARQRADRMGGESSQQYQQYLGFMNSVRNMPHSQYLLQRDQLAAQSMSQGRGGFGGPMGASDADAASAFVDRYLLSPRAPVVIADRLQAQ